MVGLFRLYALVLDQGLLWYTLSRPYGLLLLPDSGLP
jgi:hypothetical protein